MKKKIIAVALIAMGASSIIAGCSSSGQQEQTSSTTTVTTETTTAASTTTSTAAQTGKLEILDSGFSNTGGPSVGGDYFAYAFALVKNTSETEGINSPMVTFTAKDAEGKIVANQEQYGFYVGPGETKPVSVILNTGNKEATVIETEAGKPNFIADNGTWAKLTDFEVSNTSVKESDNAYSKGVTITGEIKNNFKDDIKTVAVHVLLKKGDKPVDCFTDYINDFAAGATKAFEASSYGREVNDYDSYDFYVEKWGM